jgi:hypothetical protein
MLRPTIPMNSQGEPGAKRMIDGQCRVYYDGYWIKVYDPPADTLQAKKRLIEALTRRLFNHVEHGLNIPGIRMEEARRAYQTETDAAKKRVKGAMLAGALFNRATEVFTKIVELQALGVEIGHSNALMRQCGEHLKEALELGKMVLHRSGDEGIDELWGEPFKAFAYPIEDFYESRYLKIAQTMKAIDQIAGELVATFGPLPMFTGIEVVIRDFASAARIKSETLQTDPAIFDVWAAFVASSERLGCFRPLLTGNPSPEEQQQASVGLQLVRTGRDLVSYITRARVPMPKSTREYIERCHQYRIACCEPPVSVYVKVERTGPEAGNDQILQPKSPRQQIA